MVLKFRFLPLSPEWATTQFRLKRLSSSLLLSLSAVLCLSTGSLAAERIILRFETTEVTISVGDVNNFVRQGTVDSADLQSFFQRYPQVQRVLREVLGREINVSRTVGERFFQTTTGEFVLTQLEKLISTPAAGAGLESLRKALLTSYEADNRFSLLEVVNNYPGQAIRLDVSLIERVYNDVSAFVERIQPALEVVRGVLQDFVCECPTATASPAPASATPKELLPAGSAVPPDRANCVKVQAADAPDVTYDAPDAPDTAIVP